MKAQLCSCTEREVGASGRRTRYLLCDGGITLRPFVLLTLWEGRLVSGEKAHAYIKHRHFPFMVLLCSLEGEGQHDHHGSLGGLPPPTPRQIQCAVARKRAAPSLPHCAGVGNSVTGGHLGGKTILKGFPQ